MTDDTNVEEAKEELTAEEQLKVANEKLGEANKRIEGLESKTKSTNDLAKQTKALKKEKQTAEELVEALRLEVEEFKKNQGVVTSEAEKIQKLRYDDMFKGVELDEDQRKVVDNHYQNSFTIDDTTREGMAKRASLAIAAAGFDAPKPDQLLGVASMSGAPSTKKSPVMSVEEMEHAKKMGITPEEWVKYR